MSSEEILVKTDSSNWQGSRHSESGLPGFDDRVRRLEPTKILDADAPLIIFGMVIQGVTIDD
jgi:hypothetical protein